MGRLGSRIRKLEDPRSPRDREKAREIAQKRQEMEERAQRWFESIAEAHPERVDDFLAAVGEIRRAMEEGTPKPRVAARAYSKARQRFEHGYVGGICCEDCGREGERPSVPRSSPSSSVDSQRIPWDSQKWHCSTRRCLLGNRTPCMMRSL